MRTLISTLCMSAFLVIAVGIQAPLVHAGTCVYEQQSGSWHDSVTFSECTPTDNSQVQVGGGTDQVQIGGGNPNNTVTNGGTVVSLINPLQGGGNLESFLNSILAVVIRIGTIIVILMMVYVGYLFVAARGEPGEITKARQALLWTVVGALILLGAQIIAVGIQATVNALSTG